MNALDQLDQLHAELEEKSLKIKEQQGLIDAVKVCALLGLVAAFPWIIVVWAVLAVTVPIASAIYEGLTGPKTVV